MTATDKQSLISESVAATRIDIPPAGEELDRHVVRAAPGVSRTTTVREVPTKSKSGLCSRDEARRDNSTRMPDRHPGSQRCPAWPSSWAAVYVLAPSDARPDRYLGLPHSPSNKPPRSREGRFNKVVTELLGLPGPINPGQYKSKFVIGDKTTWSLIDTGGSYHLGISE
jgi:hypothetical protein